VSIVPVSHNIRQTGLLHRQGRGFGEQTEDRRAMREDTGRAGSSSHVLQRAGRSAGLPKDEQGRQRVPGCGEGHQSGVQGGYWCAQRDRAEAEGRIRRRVRSRAGAAKVRSFPEGALQSAAGVVRR